MTAFLRRVRCFLLHRCRYLCIVERETRFRCGRCGVEWESSGG